MSDCQQELLDLEWYRCPREKDGCGAEYRSEHARDLCFATHKAEEGGRDE